jgi:hypothetical protein
MSKKDNVRFTVSLTPEFNDEFGGWAARLGVSKAQFAGMCMQAGLGSVIRAVAPQEAFTPKQMVKIMQEASRQGIDLTFQDFKHDDFKE